METRDEKATGPEQTNANRDAALQLEREKFEANRRFKERELVHQREELQLKQAGHRLSVEEVRRSGWRNPLVVAILAATVAAVGNGVVAVVNGSLQRTIEAQRAESERILEMIKTEGDSDKAAENLSFLLDAGLVHDPALAASLKSFLDQREPGTGPTLPGPRSSPSLLGGIVGPDDSVPVAALRGDHPVRSVAPAIGLLRFVEEDGYVLACSAFLTTGGFVVTAAHCVGDGSVLSIGDRNNTSTYKIDQAPVYVDNENDFAIFNTPSELPSEHPGIDVASYENGFAGQQLVGIYFRGDPTKLAVMSAGCSVVKVGSDRIYHLCDTGGGSAGAPLFSASGLRLVGMHHRRSQWGGEATSAELIAKAISNLEK